MRILFVCLGNICRSPLADGILRHMAAERGLDWEIDSAGTGGWHAGEAPDKRAIAVAKKYGVDVSMLRARQFTRNDFAYYDKIWVMDAQNYQDVIAQSTTAADKEKVDLFLNVLHPQRNVGVQDPWYDDALFEPVYQQVEEACKEIIRQFSESN